MPVFICSLEEGECLHTLLFRGDAFPLFVGPDKVAAVKEAGFQGDVVDIIVRVKQ